MKVTIKPLKGETFEVEYEADTLVKDLKETISKLKPEMPAEGQKLIYSGKILGNDVAMKEYGIKEGEFLVVMVAKAKPPAAAPVPAATPTPAAATPAAPDAQAVAASAMPTGAPGMEAAVEQLMGMGFEREQVENCLRAAFGNPDRAVEYLMSGIPENIQREQAAPPAGGAPPGGGAPPAAGGGPPAGGGFGGGAFPTMPTGGGGGGGGGGGDANLPPALLELRNSPQFAQLAQMVQTNPAALQQMLPALAQANPEAARAVSENPEAFMAMLMGAGGGGGGGGGGMGPPGGGGMGGGGGMPMEQAQAMAAQLAQNPEALAQIVAEIEQQDPTLAAAIRENPQAALPQLLQAMGGMGGGMGGGGGGGGGGQQVVRLTEEEGQAVARLCELGFERQVAAQAYLACDKNEELAANYLFENGGD